MARPRQEAGRFSSRVALLSLLLASPFWTGPARACAWERSQPVAVTPLALPEDPELGRNPGELRLLGGWRLRSADGAFGGFSGLEFLAGELLALSDRGTLWRLPPPTGNGAPSPGPWWRCRLRTESGVPDSESLAAGAATGLLLAAEGAHALYRLDPGASEPARPVPTDLPDWLRAAPPNAGLEAVAALPGERLLLLTEGLVTEGGTLRAALLEDGRFLPLRYPTDGGFVPVGADAVANTVYVLERRFSLFGGFVARIRILELPLRPAAESLLAPRILARLDPPLPEENFEAIAVRPRGAGELEIHLLSDDNFSPLQATLLLRLLHRPRRESRSD